MWTAIYAVIGSIAGLAVLVYISFLAARYFFVPSYPDEIHFATTDDGWRISLTRYRPQGTSRHLYPVVMVHGLAANRRNFDLTEDVSMARALAARGFDTWIIELRGRGLSTKPRLFSGLKYDWSFDEYVEKDLPAAMAAIRAATGAEEVHVVGFSIGALACYAWLTSPDGGGGKGVRSMVSLAGAAYFKRMAKGISGRLVRNLRWLRHRWIMRVLAPISGYWHPSPLQMIHNPENVAGRIQRRAMVNMICNFARNELLQYSDWILNDVFRSIDLRRDYRADLEKLTVPTLFLGGGRDILAPPDAVKDTMDRIGAVDKKFVICSRAQQFSVNFGHFDLTIGNQAPAEIFPLIADWFNAHEGAAVEAISPEVPASVS